MTRGRERWADRYVKECEDEICENLKKRRRVVSKASIAHNYPYCWRSEAPLLRLRIRTRRDHAPAAGRGRGAHALRVRVRPGRLWLNDDFSEGVCVGSIAELERLSC